MEHEVYASLQSVPNFLQRNKIYFNSATVLFDYFLCIFATTLRRLGVYGLQCLGVSGIITTRNQTLRCLRVNVQR